MDNETHDNPPPAAADGAGPESPEALRPLARVEGERLAPPTGTFRYMPLGETRHPPYAFLGITCLVSLVADVATKLWAEKRLDGFPGSIEILPSYLSLVLARNKGGAWGLLQATSEGVRRPFFLLVSAAAIAFIVTLYRRVQPNQRALKWGLPLVLGGALGNVFDRIRYGWVIDFVDVHVVWQGRDHHWPTFNVADIAICIGVALMAVDMFGTKKAAPMPDEREAPSAGAH